ncbi:MAG: hypothetical protein V1725_00115 [archaeon]
MKWIAVILLLFVLSACAKVADTRDQQPINNQQIDTQQPADQANDQSAELTLPQVAEPEETAIDTSSLETDLDQW